MARGMNQKPPLLVWLGQCFVPLGGLAGSIERALLAVVLIAHAAMLFWVYRIARLLVPGSVLAATAAVLFAAGGQLFVGLTHQFFVEPLAALDGAWAIWIALRAREWPTMRTTLHAAGAVTFGLLIKITAPLYFAVFLAYAACFAIRRTRTPGLFGELRRPSSLLLLIVDGGAVVAAALWYRMNWASVLEHARLSTKGEAALHYGFHASIPLKLVTWSRLLNQSFLAPALGPAFAAAAVLGLVGIFRAGKRLPALTRDAAWLSALQIALVMLIFSTADSTEVRFLLPLAGCLATLFAALLSPVPFRAGIVAIATTCAVQWMVVNAACFSPVVPVGVRSAWLRIPQASSVDRDELTRAVQVTSVKEGRYQIVGVEYPWLNANSASFFAAKNRLRTGVRSYYTTLGYAEADEAAALRRVADFDPGFFISVQAEEQPSPPDFLNRTSLPVLRAMARDPLYTRVPFDSVRGIVILQRR
jgi:hypothetical protein